ncbi:Crnkl1 [Symbiodinium sp. CCMP2592]|nr:Crnkl1 [Symbiodinium sp. CCMP2592]
MVSGWLLKQLPGMNLVEKACCATAYADDFLYKWIIKSGRALEEAYSKIRQVLIHLSAHGLEISTSKTVIIVELRGSKAQQALRKYTVALKDGLYMRFRLGAKQVDLKIVQHHVYLGAVIGYRRMGPDTLKHRVALATGQFSRLRPILRCRAVPQQLRLRLWHACIPSCLLHGLDCTGLTNPEAMQVRSLIVQQARTVVNSHSMWTHETNQDFTSRLRIVQPLERLHQAQLQWRAVLLSQVQLAEQGSVERVSVGKMHISDRAMTLPPLSEEATTEEVAKQRLREATEELRMMESLAPKRSVGLPSALSQGALQEAQDVPMGREQVDEADRRLESDRPQKWLKPGAKGSADLGKGQPQRQPARASKQHSAKGGGKGKYRQAPWRQEAEQEEWYEEDQWSSNHRENQYIQYLKTRVDLLTTLLLRHDNQLSILRLDSSFMVFIRTDMEGSLARALYDTGVTWKETKEKEPAKLESPMRVVLCQALLTAVASRFEQMVNAEDSKTTAIQLGWLTADATKLNRMKWDHEAKKHVIDSEGTQLEVKKALSMIMELVVLCKEPLVVNRFHATRPMTKETEAATLPMLLDLGMRTPSADKAWGLLRDLCGSAIWLAAGVNVRPERLQRGPLPQKLAAMQAKSNWGGRS